MNVRKIRSKKALKLLGLLISSLFIATAGYAIYSEMFMYSTVTVEGFYIKFISAANTSAISGTIAPGGAEVTFSNMKGLNGSLVTYGYAVNITNTHVTANYTVELKLDTWDGDGNYELRYVNVTMYDSTTQKGEMLRLLPGAGDVTESGAQTITAGANWRVQWDVFWWGNATTAETVDIKLALSVQ